MTSQGFVDRLRMVVNEQADGNQTKFAEIIETPQPTVNTWFNKGRFPDEKHLFNIHDKLNININWLLTGEGDKYLKEGERKKVAEPLQTYTKAEWVYIQKLISILRNEHFKEVGTLIKNQIDIAFKQLQPTEMVKTIKKHLSEEKQKQALQKIINQK